MFDFPNNPVVNQSVTAPNGGFFIWDGIKWTNGAGPAPTLYIPISGGAMSGPLTLSGNATQPLHAVPLQQVNSAAAGGPFLPTSGGTVTGCSTIATSPSVSGAVPTAFYTNTTASGTTTSTGQAVWNGWLTTDQMAAPSADSIANSANYYTVRNSTGPRIAEQVSLTIGPTNDGFHAGMYHSALAASAVAVGNLGGTSGAYSGALFGSNITSTLQNGATDVVGVIGLEVDVAAQVGSSCQYKTGLQVILQNRDAVDALNPSTAIAISLNTDSPSSKGWGRGISWGGALWPMNTTTGIMLYADPTGIASLQCASGIDFSSVTFANNFLNSRGFSVNGAGHITTAAGISFGAQVASAYNDFSKHIALYTAAGINVGSGNVVNYVAAGGGAHLFYVGSAAIGDFNAGGIVLNQGGFNCTGFGGASPTDTSTGLTFYNGGAGNIYGIGLTSGRVNYVTGASAAHVFVSGAADRLTITGTGMGFNGTPAVAKPTVTGAKGSNAALASLITALAGYGLVTDSTTA
jgi:hypothetical protein